jgi:hypothetical protein
VHALAGQRVQVGGAGGDQGLALAGAHFGDVAQVQRRAAHHLDVEVAQAQGAVGRLAHGGERLRQQRVQGGAVLVALLELVRLGPQFGVGQPPELVLEDVDRVGVAAQQLQGLLVAGPQDAFKQ